VLTEHGCKIAPSTSYAAKSPPPSARSVRDEQLKAEIVQVDDEHLGVGGSTSTASGSGLPAVVWNT
jgi:putative transposase